ncbi:MAG: AAA family ATPase [Clostridia bacterium]|nr:AAA family ATPase [Clostridia bacterium]
MPKYYYLNGASIILIASALTVSLWGSRMFPFTYELSVCLSVLALSLFVISAMTRRKMPSYTEAKPQKHIKTNEKQKSCIRFADVAANDNARKSLMELVDFLKHPEKYARLGARIPHGVLLYGPPGTGKTLLARALAGEADVPFLAMNGSDFVEMYVGVGASRVRDTFKKARKYGKCVIFIDEIDTLGRARNANSSEERDQTLNALLSEMSGFSPADGIIVVAATNRWEMLDPALLRPGRFDRQIEVGMPAMNERMDILKLHAKNKPLSKNVSLTELAKETAFFSGASLENLLNEAAIRAARRNALQIEKEDVDKAFISVTAGEDGRAHENENEKIIIAVHEAGHALVSYQLFGSNIQRISILPSSGGAAGYNLLVPEEKTLYTKEDMEKKMLVLLAGRCAEEIAFSKEGVTSGALSDIKRASEISVNYACELGFLDHPAIHEATFVKAFGGRYEISERARRILSDLYNEALSFLTENKEALTCLASELLLNESMSKSEIDCFFKRHPLHVSNENKDSTKVDAI